MKVSFFSRSKWFFAGVLSASILGCAMGPESKTVGDSSGVINGFDTSVTNSGVIGGLDPVRDIGTLGGLDLAGGVRGGYDPAAGAIGGFNPIGGAAGGFDPGAKAISLRNENSVPHISDRGREDYVTWLQWYPPKAFAISENGKWYGAQGSISTDPSVPTDPASRALQYCEKRAKQPCKLFAVDSNIVWDIDIPVSTK